MVKVAKEVLHLWSNSWLSSITIDGAFLSLFTHEEMNLRNITCPSYIFRLLSISLGCKLQKSDPSLLRKKVTLAQVTKNPRDSGIAWSRTQNHALRIPLLNFSSAFFCIHCIPRENLPQSQESNFKQVQFSSVAQSCLTLWPHGLHLARPPCLSPTPGVYPNSCPLSPWRHPTISSSVIPFSSCLWSFLASGSFQMSQLVPSGGQSIGVSASTSVLLMNIQDWFLLGWTGWISLQSKGHSRVFSNTTVEKHQFFCAQLSL